MFDKLPLLAQHILAGFISSAAYVVINAILTAKGVTGVHWSQTGIDALNAGSVGAVSVSSLLWLTPLSKKYGVGKR